MKPATIGAQPVGPRRGERRQRRALGGGFVAARGGCGDVAGQRLGQAVHQADPQQAASVHPAERFAQHQRHQAEPPGAFRRAFAAPGGGVADAQRVLQPLHHPEEGERAVDLVIRHAAEIVARGGDSMARTLAGSRRAPISAPMTIERFPTTRAEALARLAAFAPRMGAAYAAGRNSDPGPGRRADVSLLSPALRHRLVTEAEAVGTALDHHGAARAEKFVQEVFWRSYWKGYLELRPGLWDGYRAELARDRAALATNGGLRTAYESAAAGATGIACFDAWMAELRESGWLHNHVRMWVASIWIFTLRLPWTLGADLFLHHLLDGDAASNTLSWRWVAGIQTPGKHYVARAENIRRHTLGRFDPAGELDENPLPLSAPPLPAPRPLARADALPAGPFLLLLHEDDLHAESVVPADARIAAVGAIAVPERRGPTGCAPIVAGFVRDAMEDGLSRAATRFGASAEMLAPEEVARWAAGHGLPVVTPVAPVGWTAEALDGLGVPLLRLRRDWDEACWPRATKGFFPFRESIPALVARLDPRPPTG